MSYQYSNLLNPLLNNNYKQNEDGEKQQKQHSIARGSWYHAAFHQFTFVVGSGALGLPWAFAYMKPLYGCLFLLFSMVFMLYTGYQLAQMHENEDGTRNNTYVALGQKVLGYRKGTWSILPFQYLGLQLYAVNSIILGGSSLCQIVNVIAQEQGSDFSLSISQAMLIFTLTQFILVHLPDFHSLWFMSLLGSIFALGFCVVASTLSLMTIVHNHQESITVQKTSEPSTDTTFNFLNALGAIIFAFAGHAVFLETQATIKYPPSTVNPMMIAVVITYVLSQVLYASVGILGYEAFGMEVQGNVFVSTTKPTWLVLFANIMVLLHTIGVNLLNYMPIFANVEMKLQIDEVEFGSKRWILKIVERTIIVGVTLLVALFLPFFVQFNGVVGAIVCTHMNFVMPPILWLHHHKVTGVERAFNIGLVVVGVMVGVMGLIGAGRNIVVEAIAYHS
eukprot:TRINITY_DN6685_c0_g1_i3.p1 TRINITY_DN6685_c0_g1~~TRINITY_DN6685_c0_g1_i3.p1  ORF type:complete len:448 (+),score=15.17 TRINITY_DN6685_c0_g1_i3:87-1430(+)